jgi:Rod binding domain-containing protein
MTAALNPLAQANAAVQQHGGQDTDAKLHSAARQFEGVLLTQLLQVLWKTTPELAKGPGSMYQSMFQGSMAEQLAAGGGIGLADMIAKGLGAKPEQPGAGLTRHSGQALHSPALGQPKVASLGAQALHSPALGELEVTGRSTPTSHAAGPQSALSAAQALRHHGPMQLAAATAASLAGHGSVGSTPERFAAHGGPGAYAAHGASPANLAAHGGVGAAPSLMTHVTAAADGLLQEGAERWSKAGTLGASDLGSVNASARAGEQARRSVEGINGYHGYYKCNLFAFELARRAGLEVPTAAQSGTAIFPSSNRLTQDASDGSIETGWAKVATGASPAAMQDALRAGEAAFLVVGSGHGERHGHMAIVEHPRTIDYDEAGRIRSITFEGWEAQPDGAKHLASRTWNLRGEKGAPGDRNGLDRIEILQLHRKAADLHLTTNTPLQSR